MVSGYFRFGGGGGGIVWVTAVWSRTLPFSTMDRPPVGGLDGTTGLAGGRAGGWVGRPFSLMVTPLVGYQSSQLPIQRIWLWNSLALVWHVGISENAFGARWAANNAVHVMAYDRNRITRP